MRRRLFSSVVPTFPFLSWYQRRPSTLIHTAKVGLLGIREDRNSSFKQGSAAAPALIRKYFHEPAVNTWCELGFDVDKHIVDYGDVVPVTNDHAGIEAASSVPLGKILEAGLVPLILGGDHSISFSTIKTIRKHVGQPLVIVHFDAHPGNKSHPHLLIIINPNPSFFLPDIYEHYNGNLDSHACPFARVLEVPGLCAQLISIGVRTIRSESLSTHHLSPPPTNAPDRYTLPVSGEQLPMLEKYRVELLEARHFPAKGSDVMPLLKHFIPLPETPVYLTIDLGIKQ